MAGQKINNTTNDTNDWYESADTALFTVQFEFISLIKTYSKYKKYNFRHYY